jgi:hypothetical protein
MLKKQIWPNFPRIIEVFIQKIVTKPSKIWVWDPGFGIRDPGSGKNLFRIPDPGVKKAPDPGSGSATLVKSEKNEWVLSKNGTGTALPYRYRSWYLLCKQNQ